MSDKYLEGINTILSNLDKIPSKWTVLIPVISVVIGSIITGMIQWKITSKNHLNELKKQENENNFRFLKFEKEFRLNKLEDLNKVIEKSIEYLLHNFKALLVFDSIHDGFKGKYIDEETFTNIISILKEAQSNLELLEYNDLSKVLMLTLSLFSNSEHQICSKTIFQSKKYLYTINNVLEFKPENIFDDDEDVELVFDYVCNWIELSVKGLMKKSYIKILSFKKSK